jgi:hypothetical protein
VVAAYVAELQRVLSVDRLERYRTSRGDDLAMVVTYQWNIELSQSLYLSLGALETVLRNAIYDTLTAHHGRPDWYDIPNVLFSREFRSITETKDEIKRKRKAVVPGQVVAGLTFGFWVQLLSKGHGQVWHSNNHALIKQAFPNAPIGMQYRGRVHSHMNEIRLLRNRVSHHECISDDPLLVQNHANIINAIGWISPALQASTRHFDRFPFVFNAGPSRIEVRLKQHLGTS